MLQTTELLGLLGVGILWGCTNPFMKQGSAGMERVHVQGGPVAQFAAEMRYLLLNWRYVLPFVINMSGSFLYYWTLGNTDLSVATPVANTLTFMFTLLTSFLIGEQKHMSWLSLFGCACVVSGVAVCLASTSS